MASVDPKYIFREERPQLIDEWQLVPSIWDSVRHECDADHNKGVKRTIRLYKKRKITMYNFVHAILVIDNRQLYDRLFCQRLILQGFASHFNHIIGFLLSISVILPSLIIPLFCTY